MGLSTAGVGEPAALTGPGRGQANATPSGRCSDQGRPATGQTRIRAGGLSRTASALHLPRTGTG